jgi:ABC-type Mn2+/Zn2+ transport system ATPase subunit
LARESILRMHDVHAGYSATPILHGINLEVATGQLVAVLGPNGSGKTTALKAVMGLINPTCLLQELGGYGAQDRSPGSARSWSRTAGPHRVPENDGW